jgi:hypothetical protein
LTKLPFVPFLLIAFVLLHPAPPVSAQRPSLGPLTFEEGAPLQRLGYTPMLEIADPVGDGAVRVDLWMGYSNIFERDSSEVHDVYLDLERYIYTATLRYGVGDALEVGGRFTWEHTGGGFLDAFMVDFHDWFGLGSRARRRFPYGDYRVTVDDAEGRRRIDIPRRGFALEDVRLFAKWRAYRGDDGHSVVSLRAVTRVPTANDQLGTERADVSLMALGRTAWRGWHLHGGLGALTVRSSPELDDLMRDGTWFFYFGMERPFNDNLSGVIEYVESKPVMEDVGDSDVDGAITNVVLGVVGRVGTSWKWEVAMQEDFPPRGPSLDFQFQVALSKTW